MKECAVLRRVQKSGKLPCDRSRSGLTDFSQHFPETAVAPLHRKLNSVRIFIDRSSVEVFGNNGEVCMTSLVFPASTFDTVKLEKTKSK